MRNQPRTINIFSAESLNSCRHQIWLDDVIVYHTDGLGVAGRLNVESRVPGRLMVRPQKGVAAAAMLVRFLHCPTQDH